MRKIKIRLEEKSEIERRIRTVQNRRKELGYTQEDVAELIGISSTGFQYIEQRRRIPSLNIFLKICRFLKIKIRLDLD
jgi:DNA-binding XRE family transcriptional regulator